MSESNEEDPVAGDSSPPEWCLHLSEECGWSRNINHFWAIVGTEVLVNHE